jgi:hypothetical protein
LTTILRGVTKEDQTPKWWKNDIVLSVEESDIDLDADVMPTLTPTRNMAATSQADTGSGSELELYE